MSPFVFEGKNKGLALVGTLMILAGLAVLVTALITVTIYVTKTSDALSRHAALKQAAYSAMNANEQRLLLSPGQGMLANSACALGMCEGDKFNWHDMAKISGSGVPVLRYASIFHRALPVSMGLFESEGVDVYSLYAQAAYDFKSKGVLYEESYWMPFGLRKSSWLLHKKFLDVSAPHIPLYNPLVVESEEKIAWHDLFKTLNEKIRSKQSTVLNLSGEAGKQSLKLWRNDEYLRSIDTSALCQEYCNSNEGWWVNEHQLSWLYLLSSQNKIWLWNLDPLNVSLIGAHNIEIQVDGKLLSKPEILRSQEKTYLVGVVGNKKEGIALHVWDVENGDLLRTIKLNTKTKGKVKILNQALVVVIDESSNLKAGQILVLLGDELHSIQVSEKFYPYWSIEEDKSLQLLDIKIPETMRVIKQNNAGDAFLLFKGKDNVTVYSYAFKSLESQKIKPLWVRNFDAEVVKTQLQLGVLWVLDDKLNLQALELKSGNVLATLKLEDKQTSFDVFVDLYRKRAFIKALNQKIEMPEALPRNFLRTSFRQYDGVLK